MPKILVSQITAAKAAGYTGEIDPLATSVVNVSEGHMALARQLASRHGKVRLARESSGIHAYMPCPECLETDGRAELYRMHLAVNLDKFLRGEAAPRNLRDGGSASDNRLQERSDLCACCMKTGKPFLVRDLLSCLPLQDRKIITNVPMNTILDQTDTTMHMEDDGKGNLVPKHPGDTIPLNQLELNHPAVDYLYNRGYGVETLQSMYGAEWCIKERPDVNYAPIKGGWRATPQNRIILYILQNGIRMGWQARVLDYVNDNVRYYYHPYQAAWEAVQRCPRGQDPKDKKLKWEELLPPLHVKFEPRKYLFPRGVLRNQTLMGFDAAKKFNKGKGGRSYIVITEGPLSAAKLGSPGVAAMGKFFSAPQAALAAEFDIVIYVPDNDDAGAVGITKFNKEMDMFRNTHSVLRLPPEFKDLGECSTEQAQQIVEDELKSIC